ncbi:MAG: hypothetical protein ACPG1C_08545 [Alphaproteobacteria bacterium]
MGAILRIGVVGALLALVGCSDGSPSEDELRSLLEEHLEQSITSVGGSRNSRLGAAMRAQRKALYGEIGDFDKEDCDFSEAMNAFVCTVEITRKGGYSDGSKERLEMAVRQKINSDQWRVLGVR